MPGTEQLFTHAIAIGIAGLAILLVGIAYFLRNGIIKKKPKAKKRTSKHKGEHK